VRYARLLGKRITLLPVDAERPATG